MGQNSLWEVQYGGISFFSGEAAPQDGVFFICCIFPLQIWVFFFNSNAVWGKTLYRLCSMGGFSFFLLKSLHRMGYFLFVAFFHYKYGFFFFNSNAVWGKALFGLCSMGESSFFLIL
jgi:hypothetical protein